MKFLLFAILLVCSKINAYCPDGATAFQGHCYYFITDPDIYMYAGGTCNINGYLASIHSGFDNAFIVQQAKQIFAPTNYTDFWIGLFVGAVESDEWGWQDHTPLDFKEWASAQPLPAPNNCAAMNIKSGQWFSDECSNSKPFLCGLPYLPCPIGWQYFKPTNTCFGSDGWTSSYPTWEGTEKFCQSQNGHALAYHSHDETAFISDMCTLCNGQVWTGLYSDDNQTTWKYTDGSPTDYLPWFDGYPIKNVSLCVYTNDEVLLQADCNRRLQAICTKPASFD